MQDSQNTFFQDMEIEKVGIEFGEEAAFAMRKALEGWGDEAIAAAILARRELDQAKDAKDERNDPSRGIGTSGIADLANQMQQQAFNNMNEMIEEQRLTNATLQAIAQQGRQAAKPAPIQPPPVDRRFGRS